MRKFLPLFVFLLFFLPQTSFAAEINMTDSYTLPDTTSVQDNLIITAETIEINGQIQNDMIAAGREIKINGKVNGDVIVAGKDIMIKNTSSIGKSIRAAGGTITISGNIGKDVAIFAGEVYINGAIAGNARISANHVEIASNIQGSLKVDADEIILKPNTHISGDFKYSSHNEPQIMSGASINGSKIAIPAAQELTTPYFTKDFWLHILLSSLGYWLIALLLLAFVPVAVENTRVIFQTKFWQSIGMGLLAIIIGLIGSILLLVTFIGIPLGILTLVITFILLYLGQIPFLFFITHKIIKVQFNQEHNRWSTALLLLLSTLVISLVGTLPYIGGLFKIVLTCAGIGAVLIAKKNLYQELRQKSLI